MTLEDMKALSPEDCISIAEDLVSAATAEYIQKAHVYALLAIAKSLQNDSDAARSLCVPYHVKSHTKAEQDIEE